MTSNMLRNWIRKLGERLLGTGSRRYRRLRFSTAKRRATMKPSLEILETRLTPSNYVVTDGGNGAGSVSDVTLRYAVANAGNGGTITFANSMTIALSGTGLTISTNETITNTLGVGSPVAISGSNAVLDFLVTGTSVTISNLTIENGHTATSGGAIENKGTLTLSNDTISGSTANYGGGIGEVLGSLTVTNCTIANNVATISSAGGVENYGGTVTISNSTINNNHSPNFGGGVSNFNNPSGVAHITLNNDTIYGNTAATEGGGVGNNSGTITMNNDTLSANSAPTGGGIWNNSGASTTLLNSIVSLNNPVTPGTGPDMDGTIYGNYDLIGTSTGYSYAVGSGTNEAPIGSPGFTTTPGTLANNGGTTNTVALSPGSNAINAGETIAGVTPTDQRGFTRPASPNIDIGAYQLQTVTSSTAGLPANSSSITINGFAFDPTFANDTVSFSNGVTGTVTAATSTSLTVSLTGLSSLTGDTTLTANVTVDGVTMGSSVQVATVAPVITSNAANLAANATTLTIAGFGFDANANNDHVSFSNGVTGSVSGATTTTLTVSVTGLSNVSTGTALTAVATVDGATSGGGVQVATVSPPFVTYSNANVTETTTTLTINGGGFSTTPASNMVAFNLGVLGTVSSATATSLTVTVTSLATALGSLTAVVTSNGVSTGTAVQVGTEVAGGTWVVTDSNGAAASGSYSDITLPFAVAHSSSGDHVTFASAFTITLSTVLTIGHNLTITGLGTASTLISGGGAVQDFIISSGVTANISSLTVENAKVAAAGAGINNAGTLTMSNVAITGNTNTLASSVAGGIDNLATGVLIITNSTITSNSAVFSGGGVYNVAGGTLTLSNSTLTGNTAGGGGTINGDGGLVTVFGCNISSNVANTSAGGAIQFTGGTLTVSNSTLSGNSATAAGAGKAGAIDVYTSGTVTLTNDTIAYNYAAVNAGGLYIFSGPTMRVVNTIVDLNTTAGTIPNVDGTIYASNDVFGTTTGMSFTGGGTGSQQSVTNATLFLAAAPPANNGGPTSTLALGAGSVAIGEGGALTTVSSDNGSTIVVTSSAAAIGLASAIASTSGAGYPIQIGSEQLLVTGVNVSTNTLTVIRGYNGTTQVTHAATTGVYPVVDQRGYYGNFTTTQSGTSTSPDVGAYESNGTAPGTPSISGISPTFGSTLGGTSVTISGSNLSEATAVNFGNLAGTIVSDSGTSIVATTPVDLIGTAYTVDTTVIAGGVATATSSADHYTFTPPNPPVVTSSTASLLATATTITINGSGFDATAANDSVAFNDGAVGSVTGASATILTVTFSTKPTTAGSLTAVVTSDLVTDAPGPVQVATVTPVVTSNATNTSLSTTTLTIAGFGFDPTVGNNSVTFNDGAFGTVSSATATSLTVTFTTQPTGLGSLTAVVTTDAVTSGTAVQVATLALSVTSNSANLAVYASTVTIAGFGFDTNTAKDSVSFTDGAFGTVSSATATSLTVTFTTKPTALGSLSATVTTDSVANSNGSQQVANVALSITSNATNAALSTATITIAGFGFDTTVGNNIVTFNDGAAGTVSSATATSMTVTFTTKPTALGALTASVTTDGFTSGAAVTVATEALSVTSSAVTLAINSTTLTIAGFGFDPTAANDIVTFASLNALGTVTSATGSSLTVTFTRNPSTSGTLSASVTTDGVTNSNGAVQVASVTEFTAGNLVVLQVANGSVTNTTGSVLELLPSTASQANAVQTIAINGTVTTSELRFSASPASGASLSGDYLSDSNDGSLLTFSGYNTTNTTSVLDTVAARGVGTLGYSDTYTLATTYTGTSGDAAHGATTLNDSTYYITDQKGLYTNAGANSTLTTSTDLLSAKSFGGTVYIASNTAAVSAISTVASPTATTLSGLTGISADTLIQDFYLISSGSNGATFDELYTLDQSGGTATIKKFSLSSGAWTANGSFSLSGTAYGEGLAAAKNGGGAFLYVTEGTSSLTTGNSLIRLTDTAGYNSSITISTANMVTLYTAAAGTSLRGVAFSPVRVSPVVTSSSASLADSATTLTINGSNFDTVALNNTVTFNDGVVGTVSSATATTLTVTVTTPPTSLGSLTATVTTDGVSSGTAVQVETEANGTWNVVDSNGMAGSGSMTDFTLPYAVAHALSGDTITFANSLAGGNTITLNSVLTISQSITVTDASANVAVSGNNTVEVFNITAGTVSISSLTVENGFVTGTGVFGGGIKNAGTLTLTSDMITGNTCVSTSGGGVYNTGTLSVISCTVSGNSADYGGGLGNSEGVMTVTNTTVSGNKASGSAAGIENYGGSATVTSSTISGNSVPIANAAGGGIVNFNDGAVVAHMTLTNDTIYGNSAHTGGGLENFSGTITLSNDTISGNYGGFQAGGISIVGGSVMTMQNTIVAGNTGALQNPDVGGAGGPTGTITLENYSLIGNTSGWTTASAGTGDLSNYPSAAAAGLSTLASNGGPTQTVALLPGSPAISTGEALAGVTTDQRGFTRPTPPDMGAFQLSPTVTSSTVLLPVTATTLTIAGSGFDTTVAHDSVTFSNGVTGSVTSATGLSLTVSLTGLGSLTGGTALSATVTTDGQSSGSLLQVATVAPVVTANTTNLAATSTSLTINGFGFDPTATHDTVTLSNGVSDSVTAATSTTLTLSLTGLSSVAGGTALTAVATTDGASSGSAVTVATVAPVVTSNTANLAASATTLTIAGFGFDPTAAHDTVTLNNGVTDSVTSATSTTLTLSLTGLSNVAGGTALTAVATTDGASSGSAVTVATVTPTVTSNLANLADSSTTITIGGTGFSTNTANDSVTFSDGVMGSVTAATATQLTVTITAPPTALGTLNAAVTVSGSTSGAQVQVATEINGTWNVTDSNGTTPSGSMSDFTLPYVISKSLGGDTITFANGLGVINLTAVQTIGKNLTITGNGAGSTLISGNNAVEVFNITAGTVSISSLTIENGKLTAAPPNGSGAGIANAGNLTLSYDTITGNTATTGTTGGGIYNKSGGTLTLSNSIVSNNSCIYAAGIGNQGVMMVTNTTISQNTAADSGAGIYNYGGTLTMSGSTVSNNLGSGGAFGGGGIVNLTNGSAVAHMTLTNDTIYGNSGHGSGGGINNDVGTVTLTNDTISGNTAAKGGGIANASGQSMTLLNTIVAGNTGTLSPGTVPDASGTVSATNSLIGNTAGTSFSTNTSNVLNPTFVGLSAPNNYGGTTNTIALLPGSPAIDAGSNSGAPTTDQCGVARPQLNGTVDIGAFESQGFTFSIVSGNNQSAALNTAYSPLVVSVTPNHLGDPVNGGQVTYAVTPASDGAGATLATSPATIGSGQASVTPTANAEAGAYTVTASASGASSVTFNERNLPGVTSSTGRLPVTAATLTIAGAGFDTTAANDSVSFTNGGLTGTVSSASSSSLTVTLTGLTSITGGTAVDASVTVDGSSNGSAVQVATAAPVVTSSSAYLLDTATSMTINGYGFDTIAGNDSVTFNDGVTGSVTNASGTSLTVSLTGLSSVTGDTALDATATVDGTSSGSMVQVATVEAVTTTSLTDNGPNPTYGQAVNYTVNTVGVPNNSIVYIEESPSDTIVGSVMIESNTGSTSFSFPGGGSPVTYQIFATYPGAAGFTASQSSPTLPETVNPITVGTPVVNGDFAPVVDMSESGHTVTITTDGNNGFSAGNQVVIAGETGTSAPYNGTWTIASVGVGLNADTFTFADATGSLPAVSFNSSGYAISANSSSALLGVQRSMVDSVAYTFNTAVSVNPGAITLGNLTPTTSGPATPASLPATMNWTSLNGGTTWVATFSSAAGNTVSGHSIADGVYTLTLNNADVTPVAGGTPMSTTRAVDTFYRLYGDVQGHMNVNANDAMAFNNTYLLQTGQTGYLASLDYLGNGRVNANDLTPFNSRYLSTWSGFTPTI